MLLVAARAGRLMGNVLSGLTVLRWPRLLRSGVTTSRTCRLSGVSTALDAWGRKPGLWCCLTCSLCLLMRHSGPLWNQRGWLSCLECASQYVGFPFVESAVGAAQSYRACSEAKAGGRVVLAEVGGLVQWTLRASL